MESIKDKGFKVAKFPSVPKQRLFNRNVKVMSNHFEMDLSGLKLTEFYVYKIKIIPQISLDNRKLKHQILEKIRPELNETLGWCFCTGWVLFAEKLSEDVIIFEPVVNKKDYVVDVQIIKTKAKKAKKIVIGDIHNRQTVVNEKQITQFINSIMKQSMKQMGYKDIGILSKYYDTKNQQLVNNCDLKVYKGFYVSVDLYQDRKFKLLVDLSTRVLQSKDCLQFMNSIANKKEMEDNVIGNSVIAQYGNNRTYYIDDIVYNKSPNSTFDFYGKTISYKDYYQKTYKINVKDTKQPLLLSNKRQKDSEGNIVVLKIYLIPELVNVTGMTDRQRSNFKVMQELAKHTKIYPDQRVEGQDKLVNKLAENIKDNKLPIKVGQPAQINASVYSEPKIYVSKAIKAQNGDFKKEFRQVVYEPSQFVNWLVVYHQDNYNDADNLANTMLECGKQYGIQVKQPEYTEIDGKNTSNWSQYTLEDVKALKNIQIVVVLLPNNQQDKIYNSIKETCYNQLNIPCQCIRPRTLQKNIKSVCSNILLQMNVKNNKVLWKVERPNGLVDNTMIIGIDVHHGGVGNKKFSVVGFVATMDNDFTKYYSRTSVQQRKNQEIISKGIVELLESSLIEYNKKNKKLPTQIIIFRDGVGDSMFQHVLDKELEQVQQCISILGNKMKQNYIPQLVILVVDKRIKDKFYMINSQFGQQNRSGTMYSNCESGTIVDSQVTHLHFWQFFMVAQNVGQGTATPTRYILIHNSSQLNGDQIQQLAYFQCFNYYNWTGAIKVPAVIKYADSIAQRCPQIYKDQLKQKEPINMAHSLYYL